MLQQLLTLGVGFFVGALVGAFVGAFVGVLVGATVGAAVGAGSESRPPDDCSSGGAGALVCGARKVAHAHCIRVNCPAVKFW